MPVSVATAAASQSDNIHEGLARTGHPLVPMVWELDRICDGDTGGYIHWGATTQNITQTGKLLMIKKAHSVFLRQIGELLELLANLAEETIIEDHHPAGCLTALKHHLETRSRVTQHSLRDRPEGLQQFAWMGDGTIFDGS